MRKTAKGCVDCVCVCVWTDSVVLMVLSGRWEHLIYQLGGHQELIRYVVIRGNVVYNNDKTMDF